MFADTPQSEIVPRPRRLLLVVMLLVAVASSATPGGGGPAPARESTAADERAVAPFDIVSIGRPSLRTFTSKDGLPQNAITSIVMDRDGLLWIGTKDGLASYNGRTWQVLNVPAEIGKNIIDDVVPTSSGEMWVLL